MTATDYWKMFLQTGAPAFYLQYKALMMEEEHVSDNSGCRPESYRIQ